MKNRQKIVVGYSTQTVVSVLETTEIDKTCRIFITLEKLKQFDMPFISKI